MPPSTVLSPSRPAPALSAATVDSVVASESPRVDVVPPQASGDNGKKHSGKKNSHPPSTARRKSCRTSAGAARPGCAGGGPRHSQGAAARPLAKSFASRPPPAVIRSREFFSAARPPSPALLRASGTSQAGFAESSFWRTTRSIVGPLARTTTSRSTRRKPLKPRRSAADDAELACRSPRSPCVAVTQSGNRSSRRRSGEALSFLAGLSDLPRSSREPPWRGASRVMLGAHSDSPVHPRCTVLGWCTW
jgi:hypothetical protein